MKFTLPSPAMSVALIALFVALGGTSYAAVKINGKNIKKGTIKGTALKKNTLTGVQVRESKLGKVPSATRADSAAVADNAGTLGGLTSGEFVKGTGRILSGQLDLATSSEATLVEIPGFATITAICGATNSVGFRLTAATTNLTYSMMRIAGAGNTSFAGSLFAVGAGSTTPETVVHTLSGNIWQKSTGRVAQVNASSYLCKAAATVTTNG